MKVFIESLKSALKSIFKDMKEALVGINEGFSSIGPGMQKFFFYPAAICALVSFPYLAFGTVVSILWENFNIEWARVVLCVLDDPSPIRAIFFIVFIAATVGQYMLFLYFFLVKPLRKHVILFICSAVWPLITVLAMVMDGIRGVVGSLAENVVGICFNAMPVTYLVWGLLCLAFFKEQAILKKRQEEEATRAWEYEQDLMASG